MLRRHLRYSSFSILLFSVYCLVFSVSGCAPKVALPPPQYKDLDLTLEEIIATVRKDVDALKVIAGIDIEKDSKPHSYIDAVILLKKPDWLHVRLYKFGIPAGEFLITEFLITEDKRLKIENTLSGGSSKLDGRLKEFSKWLYQSFFWWEGLQTSDCRLQIVDCRKNILMLKDETEYVIKTEDREIHLDKTTLLLKRQEIVTTDKRISILYEEPKMEGDFWYSSLMKIESGNYRVFLRIEKLFINPSLKE